jgi:hypothetical protein
MFESYHGPARNYPGGKANCTGRSADAVRSRMVEGYPADFQFNGERAATLLTGKEGSRQQLEVFFAREASLAPTRQ